MSVKALEYRVYMGNIWWFHSSMITEIYKKSTAGLQQASDHCYLSGPSAAELHIRQRPDKECP